MPSTLTQEEINSLPPPPQEWLDEMEKEKNEANDKILFGKLFGENPVLNYYNIRNKNYQSYYDEAKLNGQSRASVRDILPKSAGGGDTWCNELAKWVNPKTTVRDFFDTLVKETRYSGFSPYKTWMKMTVIEFVRYFLNELDFYHCNATKKHFFNILINYYFVKFCTQHRDDSTPSQVCKQLGVYCQEWCEINGKNYLGFKPQVTWALTVPKLKSKGPKWVNKVDEDGCVYKQQMW